MKKIVYYDKEYEYMSVHDSTDYIILGKDNQRISDKYVNMNSVKVEDLMKDDLVIRELYYINWANNFINVCLTEFKYYEQYFNNGEYTDKIKESLNTKDSIVDLKEGKIKIVNIFSNEMKIKYR